MRILTRVFVPLLLLFAVACGGPTGEEASLLLTNGKIVTLAGDGTGEVEALAAKDGRILAVGTSAEIEAAHVGPATEVIDLEGRLAVPGFIEGHAHFSGIGEAQLNLNLMNVANWDNVVGMVAEAVKTAEPGEWIRGRGWHQEKWDTVPEPNVDGLPTHDSLSAASPDNPVVLRHASGHASFANAKAMEEAGVDRSTPDPDGGEIVRDARGEPIGMFRETAQGLLRRAGGNEMTPEERAVRRDRVIELATDECLSKGITSFQDAGSGFGLVDRLREMAQAGELRIRLWMMLRAGNEALSEQLPDYRIIGAGDNFLTVRAIKRSIDGALGPHGAWLLEPYADMPSSSGLNTSSIESITETARLAAENGFQLCVHAIGDRANREVLDIFEKTFASYPDEDTKDWRWRIEHSQHIHPDDIPRFGRLGVIASMQGIHCTSDGPWVLARLGEERARTGAYMWQALMQSGALVTNGTDAPVEDVNPIASYYATVSRMMDNGERFFPEQAMSREEALRSYTIVNARAAFEEDVKGTLEVGKLADVTVLSRDILTIPEEDIPATSVVYTIVGGEVAWPRK